MTSLPCDRCVGRSLNLCEPLDDARLRLMLSLGCIHHWCPFEGEELTDKGKPHQIAKVERDGRNIATAIN